MAPRKKYNRYKLSDKQQKFCDEYLKDLNGAQAAIRAGYKAQYAAELARQMLDKVGVQLYLAERQEKIREKTEISQERVIEELSKIAFADIRQFVDFRTEQTQVGTDRETGEPIIDWAVIVDIKDSKDVDGAIIQEVSRGPGFTFKFKLHDKIRSLEMLGKHLGIFDDKHKAAEDMVKALMRMSPDERRKNLLLAIEAFGGERPAETETEAD